MSSYKIASRFYITSHKRGFKTRLARKLGEQARKKFLYYIPTQKIEGLLAGLRHVEKYGSKLPRNPQMRIEPERPESYVKIYDMMGLGDS